MLYSGTVNNKHSGFRVLFLLENNMEKSEKNKAKDRERTAGYVWEDMPVKKEERTTGSGVTFSGRYVEDWSDPDVFYWPY